MQKGLDWSKYNPGATGYIDKESILTKENRSFMKEDTEQAWGQAQRAMLCTKERQVQWMAYVESKKGEGSEYTGRGCSAGLGAWGLGSEG
jgi:hypothetical protein